MKKHLVLYKKLSPSLMARLQAFCSGDIALQLPENQGETEEA